MIQSLYCYALHLKFKSIEVGDASLFRDEKIQINHDLQGALTIKTVPNKKKTEDHLCISYDECHSSAIIIF